MQLVKCINLYPEIIYFSDEMLEKSSKKEISSQTFLCCMKSMREMKWFGIGILLFVYTLEKPQHWGNHGGKWLCKKVRSSSSRYLQISPSLVEYRD